MNMPKRASRHHAIRSAAPASVTSGAHCAFAEMKLKTRRRTERTYDLARIESPERVISLELCANSLLDARAYCRDSHDARGWWYKCDCLNASQSSPLLRW